MREKIRLGVIGAGAIAKLSHVPAIQQVPEAELVAICRRTKEEADRLGQEWEAKEVYYDQEDLLKSKNVDAVIVATPNINHKDAVVSAAEQGKHVLCEKPLATNLKDAREMVKVCKDHNVKLQVGFNQRFWNQIIIAKSLIDKGTIGKIMGFSSSYRERWDIYPAVSDYRYHLDQSGGACIIDLAIHRIDMARFLVGDITEVYAQVKHSVISPKVDDNVWILCNFENGAVGCISSDRYSPPVDNATSLYGTEGTLCLSTETFNPFQSVPLAVYTEKSMDKIPKVVSKYFYPEFWWSKPEKSWISIIPPRDNPYVNQLKSFCSSIIQDKETQPSGEDGVKALEVVLAAYKSAREKMRVTLPLKEEIIESPNYE